MKIIQIKTNLGCILDETMSEKTMALPNINKINNKIKSLSEKHIFNPETTALSSTNSTAFSLCFLIKKVKLIQKLKNRIQTSQNKCICFYQHLDKMIHISHKEFETLLPMTERFNQCINLIVFKYVNDQWPNYLHEVSQTAPENYIRTRESFRKLKCPFRITNVNFC